MIRMRRVGKDIEERLQEHLKVLNIPGLIYGPKGREDDDDEEDDELVSIFVSRERKERC